MTGRRILFALILSLGLQGAAVSAQPLAPGAGAGAMDVTGAPGGVSSSGRAAGPIGPAAPPPGPATTQAAPGGSAVAQPGPSQAYMLGPEDVIEVSVLG